MNPRPARGRRPYLRRYGALAVAALGLAACASPEERAAREQRIVARLQEACERQGFKPGTVALDRCIQQMYAAETQPGSVGATPAAPGTCTAIGGGRLNCY